MTDCSHEDVFRTGHCEETIPLCGMGDEAIS